MQRQCPAGNTQRPTARTTMPMSHPRCKCSNATTPPPPVPTCQRRFGPKQSRVVSVCVPPPPLRLRRPLGQDGGFPLGLDHDLEVRQQSCLLGARGHRGTGSDYARLVWGTSPPEGTLGYVTCALAANSTKRRKKMGSSVAYKTIGTFLSQDKRHEDACGWATEMRNSGCAAVRHRPTLCFTHRTCKFDLFLSS